MTLLKGVSDEGRLPPRGRQAEGERGGVAPGATRNPARKERLLAGRARYFHPTISSIVLRAIAWYRGRAFV